MEENTEDIMQMVLAANDPLVLNQQELFRRLSRFINTLITNNFEELVSLLYRLDIDEKKLRNVLQQKLKNDTADLIATMIIERQQEKIISRQKFKSGSAGGNEETW